MLNNKRIVILLFFAIAFLLLLLCLFPKIVNSLNKNADKNSIISNFNFPSFLSNRKLNSFAGLSNYKKADAEEPPKYPFKIGEELRYGIYSTGFKVGDATITYLGEKEINGLKVSCVVLEAKGPGFYDKETIYGNIENSAPVRIERKIKLFGKNEQITEEYDQIRNVVRITKNSKAAEGLEIKSQERINNIILLLYNFRYKNEHQVGSRFGFNLPTRKLEMLVERMTEIKVPAGQYSSIFIRSIPSQFKVWFRNNGDNVPLRIQGAIGFGNTYLALLNEYSPKE